MAEPSNAAAEWRSGWTLVLCCTLGQTLLGVGFASAGTFMAPIQEAFGWSKQQFSSSAIVYVVPGTVLAPLIGMLLDRHGTRAVVLPGAVTTGLAIALFSTFNGSLFYWLALWTMLATATQFIMHTMWAAALSNHFSASRKQALAILSMANGFTLFVAPLLANFLMERVGWRNAYVFLGLGWGGLVFLLNFFLLHDHRSRRVRAAAIAQPAAAMTGLTVREGLRSGAFRRIVAAVLLCNLLNIALSWHMVEILRGTGLGRDSAVFLAATFGVWMLVGNLAFGVIGDRVPARLLGGIVVVAPAITCAILLLASNSWFQSAAAIAIFGLSCGLQGPAFTYLSTRHFGMKSFGTLRGFMASGLAIATAIAPFIAARIHDETGSYDGFLIAGIPPLLLAGLLLLTLGPYPQFDTSKA